MCIRDSPYIAWPLRLFDCSPVTDGASAVLLVGEELAKRFTDDPLYIIAVSYTHLTLPTSDLV